MPDENNIRKPDLDKLSEEFKEFLSPKEFDEQYKMKPELSLQTKHTIDPLEGRRTSIPYKRKRIIR